MTAEGTNRGRGRFWPIALSLVAVLGVSFARLIASPKNLLVDPIRPSVDSLIRGKREPGNDLTRIFLPQRASILDAIRDLGRVPYWDPAGFGGRPRLGNPQAGLFYPPSLIAWFTRAPAALGWLTAAHLLWGGFGVYFFLRIARVGRFGAVVAAACYETSPYLIAQTFEGHYPHVWGASWYPWALLANALWRKGDYRGAFALPWITALSLLTGHPQEGYYLLIILGCWWCWDWARIAWKGGWAGDAPGDRFENGTSVERESAERDSAERTTASIRFDPPHGRGRSRIWSPPGPRASFLVPLAITVVALGLTAVEVIPDAAATRYALAESKRSIAHASSYHINFLNLFQLITPKALGGPADYFGHDNYWEPLLSIGWGALLLAAIGAARHRDRALGLGLLAATLLAVAFAAGRRFVLFALFYELIPGMDRFRVPSRSLFLASLGASALAGLGAEALVALAATNDDAAWRSLWIRYRRLVAPIAALLIAGLILAETTGLKRNAHPNAARSAPTARDRGLNRKREANRWILAAATIAKEKTFLLSFMGTTALVAWGAYDSKRRRGIAVSFATLAVAELAIHAHGILRTAPPSVFLGPDPISNALVDRREEGPFRIRAHDSFYSDLRARIHGIEKSNVYDSFQIQHSADLYRTLFDMYRPRIEPTATADDDPATARAALVRRAVLDRMNVAYVVSGPIASDLGWPVDESGTWNGTAWRIERNPSVLPRAYVVPRSITSRDASRMLDRLIEINPRECVITDLEPILDDGPRQGFTAATYDASDPDHILIEATTKAPGLLVIADTWMPGWSAEVDGVATAIIRGDHAHRVIPLAFAGRHKIELRYHPPGFTLGIAITTASALGWTAAAAGFSLASRRRGTTIERRFRAGRFARAAKVAIRDRRA